MILLDPLARPVIGHRGASGRFPENTLVAFHQALREGADSVEFDVRLTADGCPIVMHDATLDRTTDGRGRVRDVPLAAIRELNAGNGERVPTLAEVLDELDGTPVIVEIKEVGAGRPVTEVIRAAGSEHRVVVGSEKGRALLAARHAGIPTVASRRETGWHWLGSRVGGTRRELPYQAFSVPEHYRGLKLVDDRFVAAARRMHKPVHVWTVDDVSAATRLRTLGVAGIMTNFPATMRALPAPS